MDDDHVGYLDLDGRIARLRSARCAFEGGHLHIEAAAAKCKLHLRGIPFPGAGGVADLAGRAYGPTDVPGDPIAEGGIETRHLWLSFERLGVRCGGYDSTSGVLTVEFQGEVRDAETGRSGSVDCTLRCEVVARL